jgi:hypothetical protein
MGGKDNMKKILVGMTLLTLVTTGTAMAAPSITGSTGMIATPSSDVVRQGDVSLGYYNLDAGAVGNMNIGIMKNVEIGLSSFEPDAGSRQNRMNAKWSIVPETVVTPGLAIGVEDINKEDERSGYIVGSKALPLGFRVHYGIGDGRYDGVFGSIEKTISPIGILTGDSVFPATTLIAEYDGNDVNLGARMSVIPGIKIDAGWTDMKDARDFYVGFSITK